MKERPLPLGVDIGSSRLRVVHMLQSDDGVRIQGAATRAVAPGAVVNGAIADSEYLSALIEDAVIELNVRRARCVAALGTPAATLHVIALPSMSPIERNRTVRFEAARFCGHAVEDCTVRVRPLEDGKWAIGIIRGSALRTLVYTLKRAGLRPAAVADTGCCFRQAFAQADAVVDVGYERSVLYRRGAFQVWTIAAGGAQISSAISDDLAIDLQAAEKRKRILGTAGAGEEAKRQLAAAIAATLRSWKQTNALRAAVFVGNGARLSGLIEEVEAASGVACSRPAIPDSSVYPKDVLRSRAPDLALASALAQWRAA